MLKDSKAVFRFFGEMRLLIYRWLKPIINLSPRKFFLQGTAVGCSLLFMRVLKKLRDEFAGKNLAPLQPLPTNLG